MSKPKVMILRTAGTNCDEETAHAWQLAGAETERVHIRELAGHPDRLKDYAILTIPGGFSYGDDISAGKILANQMVHHLADALQSFLAAGKLILGICNGFQVLVKAGLLPGAVPGQSATSGNGQTVTLTQNDSARFEARWIHLRCWRQCAFLPDGAILAMPIAHGEGKLVAADDSVLAQLKNCGHIALTYCDAEGQSGPYPVNPNGSQADIAGLIDATGRILGLMPHPERHVCPTQHPEWTRRPKAAADGRVVFETAVRTAKSL
ncbi:MAG: phosphoribosylformylglycinamidine synthase I [Phycisphaerae bacterium]|nr:phosphoribosylformylglycinamidine synthase I [Phycisphaerae bacterium]